MNEKKAREIIDNAKLPHDGNDQLYRKARGYLEALEKVKILEEALVKIEDVQLDPSLGQIVGSEHYEKAWLDCVGIANAAFTTWEKIK